MLALNIRGGRNYSSLFGFALPVAAFLAFAFAPAPLTTFFVRVGALFLARDDFFAGLSALAAAFLREDFFGRDATPFSASHARRPASNSSPRSSVSA